MIVRGFVCWEVGDKVINGCCLIFCQNTSSFLTDILFQDYVEVHQAAAALLSKHHLGKGELKNLHIYI